MLEFHPDGSVRAVDQSESLAISRVLIDRYNQAAKLIGERQHQQALEIFERILEPSEDSDKPLEVTAEFLGVVELRKIYCLTLLKRYEEAKTLCESNRMVEIYLDQLDMNALYDYFFLYGNVLGHLGQVAEMDRQMTIALKIASEHLGSLEKCELALKSLLDYGKANQSWDYLLEQSQYAHRFGINNGSLLLQWIAGESAFYALRGLGRVREARQGAEKILKRYEDANQAEKVAEWKQLLQSVQI